MKRIPITWAAGLFMVALAGIDLVSPAVTIKLMRASIERRDAAKVETYINRDRLKASLKSQMKAGMARQMVGDGSTDNGFSMLGASLGLAMVEPMIDSLFEEQDLTGLLAHSVGQGEKGFSDIDYHRTGFGEFVVQAKEGERLAIFERDWLRWKLVEVKMPNHLFDHAVPAAENSDAIRDAGRALVDAEEAQAALDQAVADVERR